MSRDLSIVMKTPRTGRKKRRIKLKTLGNRMDRKQSKKTETTCPVKELERLSLKQLKKLSHS